MMDDAKAVDYQLANRWPPDDTRGFVTSKGRTFHGSKDCPGYQQGVREAAKKGRTEHPVEFVSARVARQRNKGACARCWSNGQPVFP